MANEADSIECRFPDFETTENKKREKAWEIFNSPEASHNRKTSFADEFHSLACRDEIVARAVTKGKCYANRHFNLINFRAFAFCHLSFNYVVQCLCFKLCFPCERLFLRIDSSQRKIANR
jgi:hypothetical protein